MATKSNGAGKGNVKLDDGRIVKLWGPEHKEVLLAKKLAAAIPKPEPKEEGPTFSPPPPPIGKPNKDPDTPKGKVKTKKEEQIDEIEDFKQLIAAFFYGLGAATGTPEYAFSESECEAVAKPLTRIVARYSRVRKVVQQVADPVALVIAVALPLAAKHAASEKRKRSPRMQAPSETPVNVQTQVPEPPPPPTRNGTVPMESVLSRISEGS